MAESFVCSICGKEHAGLISDWAFTLPDDVWAVPEPERSEIAQFTSDLCQYDERHFIRGVLEVPFEHGGGFFGWGVWAEVEWSVFERYLELYDADARSEPPHDGVFANAIPDYEDTKGTPVTIQFRESTKRPALLMKPTDQSLLGREQRNGIVESRHHEIVERLVGPSR